MFIVLLTFIILLLLLLIYYFIIIDSLATKCLSLNDEPFMVRLILLLILIDFNLIGI